ncbi:trypsin-like cysteine/serine peptidase domain-containing protein [Pelagophyceae sp. CCMP2097]|nr:trypsin-like cysteine/serine peptidase domain-containing protein [Pelagophyceae sp. CCMP2097]
MVQLSRGRRLRAVAKFIMPKYLAVGFSIWPMLHPRVPLPLEYVPAAQQRVLAPRWAGLAAVDVAAFELDTRPFVDARAFGRASFDAADAWGPPPPRLAFGSVAAGSAAEAPRGPRRVLGARLGQRRDALRRAFSGAPQSVLRHAKSAWSGAKAAGRRIARAPANRGVPAAAAPAAAAAVPAPAPEANAPVRYRGTSFVAEAAAAVGPSVVRVDVMRAAPAWPAGGDEPRGECSRASGFVFERTADRALVLTNAHVVDGAVRVGVVLADGDAREATVLGLDESTDLAVVAFDRPPADLKAAALGDDATLRVGDWVVAIGHPIGLDNTVTLGIVSSLRRSLSESFGAARAPRWGSRVRFIQTDVALNPGNSGGPLCDEFGRVVGINTATALHAEGIGFAVPIAQARRVAAELALGRRFDHSYVGFELQQVTPDVAQKLKLADANAPASGIVVRGVAPDSPAAVAGLLPRDVIVRVGAESVRTVADVISIVDATPVGDVLTLTLRRQGAEIRVPVTTSSLHAATARPPPPQPEPA